MRWKPVLTPLPNSVPEVVKTVVLVTAGAAVFPAGPLMPAVQDGAQSGCPHPAAGKTSRRPLDRLGVLSNVVT